MCVSCTGVGLGGGIWDMGYHLIELDSDGEVGRWLFSYLTTSRGFQVRWSSQQKNFQQALLRVRPSVRPVRLMGV
jgi:hypothetical protein